MILFQSDSFSPFMVALFGFGGLVLLIINCMLLCYMHRRQKKKKIQGINF